LTARWRDRRERFFLDKDFVSLAPIRWMTIAAFALLGLTILVSSFISGVFGMAGA
jgi:hypothetical protein